MVDGHIVYEAKTRGTRNSIKMPVWRADRNRFQWMAFDRKTIPRKKSARTAFSCTAFSNLPGAPQCLLEKAIEINLQRRAAHEVHGKEMARRYAENDPEDPKGADNYNAARQEREKREREEDPDAHAERLAEQRADPHKKARDAAYSHQYRARQNAAFLARLAEAQRKTLAELYAARDAARLPPEKLDEAVATILDDATLHPVYRPDGTHFGAYNLRHIMDAARSPLGINVFFTTSCPEEQWGKFSGVARRS